MLIITFMMLITRIILHVKERALKSLYIREAVGIFCCQNSTLYFWSKVTGIISLQNVLIADE